jgi:hypothetical protein
MVASGFARMIASCRHGLQARQKKWHAGWILQQVPAVARSEATRQSIQLVSKMDCLVAVGS